MKRVLVASMMHESNSFNPIIAGENDFGVVRGEKLFERNPKNDPLRGVMDTLQEQGYEVVPTLFASAVPNGEVDYEFYLGLKEEILERARQAQEEKPLDAITLALHGSMRVKGLGDAEGYLLEELREIFQDIPIFSALDMHTTMTVRMHENCDGFVGFKCAPHTDRYETGVHAAKMTIATLENHVQAKSAWVKVPILIAGEQSSTTVEPMKGLITKLRETEQKEGILAASYLMGFPWADNEDSSVAVYIVAENQELADSEALRLADIIWNTRNDFCFQTETYTEEETLNVAFDAIANGQELPVYLSDSGDNPTAGSSSDCTGFLKRIMEDPRTEQLKTPVLYGESMTRRQHWLVKEKWEKKLRSHSVQSLIRRQHSRLQQPEQSRLMWKNGKRHQSLVTLHCFIPAVLTLFLQRVISVMFRRMYLLILEEIRRKQILLYVN